MATPGSETYLMTTLLSERTELGRARYAQSLSYLWGREDAGDDRLQNALGRDRIAATVFAEFSADEADRYASQECCFLSNIRDQYERLVAAYMSGSTFRSDATGDTFRVLTYMPVSNETFTEVIDGPHGVPSSVPVGGRVTFSPHILAGYRLVTSGQTS